MGSPSVLFNRFASLTSRRTVPGAISSPRCSSTVAIFVLAAGLQARLDLTQTFSAPEAKQHPVFLGADQQQRAVGEIHQVSPFDDLVEG